MDTLPTQAHIRTMRLADLLRSFMQGAPFAVTLALIAAVTAFLVTRQMDPTYRATTSLLASQPSATYGSIDLIAPPAIDSSVYQRAVLDGPVIPVAIMQLEGIALSPEELELFKRNVRVTVEDQRVSGVIKIEVSDQNPEKAASYANALGAELIEWDRNRAQELVDNGVIAIENSIRDLDAAIARAVEADDQAAAARLQAANATLREQRVRELEAARARSTGALVVGVLQVIGQADPPIRPSSPRLAFNVLVALVLGAALGYGIHFARRALYEPVETPERLGEIGGVPVLASFPGSTRGDRGTNAEATALLRTGLLSRWPRRPQVTVGITSTTSFHEKLGIAASVAESLARSGRRVLLIDGDIRHVGPGLGVAASKGIDSAQSPGFESYLKNPVQPLRPVPVAADSRLGLDVLPTRSAVRNGSDLLEYGLSRFLEELGDAYEFVIVDLPPVLGSSDAVTAAPAFTSVVLCTSSEAEASSVRTAVDLLSKVGAPLDATVLIRGRSAKVAPTVRDPAREQLSRRGQRRRGQTEEPPAPRAMARVKSR